MPFRPRFGIVLVGLSAALAGLGALGSSGCGGTSVRHVSDGGTGAGGNGGSGSSKGGSANAGTGGGAVAPCSSVDRFAGPEYVDWNVPPDMSCEGMEVYCYESEDPYVATCIDAGAGAAEAPARPPDPAPPMYGCPNVRTLCRTEHGCCESIFTFVAGPRITFDDPDSLPCCYLARPGSYGR